MRERLAEVDGARARGASSARRARAASASRRRSQAEAGRARADRRSKPELRRGRDVAAEHKQLSLDLFSTEADKRGACERIRERQRLLAERQAAAGRAHRRTGAAPRGAGASAAPRASGAAASSDGARRPARDALTARSRHAIAALEPQHAALRRALSRQRAGSAAAAESRLNTLLELKRNFDGVSDGVKALLAEDDAPPGLLGVVADVLEVPATLPGRARGLARRGRGVRAGRGPRGDRARARAAARAGERAAPRWWISRRSRPAPLPELPEGTACSAARRTWCAASGAIARWCERLLGSVIVVEDARRCRRAWRSQSEGGLRFVSLDGEVWERGRVRAGSLAQPGRPAAPRDADPRAVRRRWPSRRSRSRALDARARGARGAARARALARRASSAAARSMRARTALETAGASCEAAERERRWATAEADERAPRDRDHRGRARDAGARARRGRGRSRRVPGRAGQRARAARRSGRHGARARVAAATRRRHARRRRARRCCDLSREAGRVARAQWARAEQTRRELEAGHRARATTSAERTRQQVAEIEAEVHGPGVGLTGLLESEATQRERVVELQKRFQALKAEVQGGEDDGAPAALRADRAGRAAAPARAGPRAGARRAGPHVRAAAHRVRDGSRAVDARAAARGLRRRGRRAARARGDAHAAARARRR